MSEGIRESVPTSQDSRSQRPTKRRALTPASEQAVQIDSLFKNPDKEVKIPPPSTQITSASLPPPPEIVANVQGSSAGAGSGEFHVYKAARRREYERIRLMELETKTEQENAVFNKKMEEARRKDEEKTDKNRKKREKRKAARGQDKKDHMFDHKGAQAVNATKDKIRQRIDANGKASEADAKLLEDTSETAPVSNEEGVIIHDDD